MRYRYDHRAHANLASTGCRGVAQVDQEEDSRIWKKSRVAGSRRSAVTGSAGADTVAALHRRPTEAGAPVTSVVEVEVVLARLVEQGLTGRAHGSLRPLVTRVVVVMVCLRTIRREVLARPDKGSRSLLPGGGMWEMACRGAKGSAMMEVAGGCRRLLRLDVNGITENDPQIDPRKVAAGEASTTTTTMKAARKGRGCRRRGAAESDTGASQGGPLLRGRSAAAMPAVPPSSRHHPVVR